MPAFPPPFDRLARVLSLGGRRLPNGWLDAFRQHGFARVRPEAWAWQPARASA